MPRGNPSWTSNFDRFLIDFGIQLGPPNLEKSSPRLRESTIFQKIAFRILHPFFHLIWCQHASIFASKTHQHCCKNPSWKASFFDRFLHRYIFHLCSILDANLEPKLFQNPFPSWFSPCPGWHRTIFRILKDVLDGMQGFEVPRPPENGPKTIQIEKKCISKSEFFLVFFLVIFGQVFIDFGLHLGTHFRLKWWSWASKRPPKKCKNWVPSKIRHGTFKKLSKSGFPGSQQGNSLLSA